MGLENYKFKDINEIKLPIRTFVDPILFYVIEIRTHFSSKAFKSYIDVLEKEVFNLS